MIWNEISAISVPEYRVVMLYREHDLYPVVGWYLPDGIFILEEGGTEDDPTRRHPAFTWRPTHWAELPLLPSDHEHRSAELAAVVPRLSQAEAATRRFLYDYRTGEHIREATPEEYAASLAAEMDDDGRGVIEVDGRSVYAV